MNKLISGIMIMLLIGNLSFAQSSLDIDTLIIRDGATVFGDLIVSGTGGGVSDSGLVLSYNFANDATPVADLSTAGNVGTLNGAVWSSAGFKDGCYTFNGANQWIETVANRPSLSLVNGLTIMGWIKVPAPITGTYPMIATKAPSSSANNFPGNFEFRIDPPGLLTFCYEYAAYSIEWIRGVKEVDDGNWHWVCVTQNSATKVVRLYVDGVLDAEKTMSTLPLANAEPVRIGKRKDGNFFNGRIDELRIYGRAVGATEISKLYADYMQQPFVSRGFVVDRITQDDAAAENVLKGNTVVERNLTVNGAIIGTMPAGDLSMGGFNL